MTITSGNGPGPARNDEERLDREWMRGQIATVPAHHAVLVWARVDMFTPVCHTCGRLSPPRLDGDAQQIADEHESRYAA